MLRCERRTLGVREADLAPILPDPKAVRGQELDGAGHTVLGPEGLRRSAALEAATSPGLGTGGLYSPRLLALLRAPSYACDRLLTYRVRPIAYRKISNTSSSAARLDDLAGGRPIAWSSLRSATSYRPGRRKSPRPLAALRGGHAHRL
jgi:hypothetical protein